MWKDTGGTGVPDTDIVMGWVETAKLYPLSAVRVTWQVPTTRNVNAIAGLVVTRETPQKFHV